MKTAFGGGFLWPGRGRSPASQGFHKRWMVSRNTFQ